MQEEIEPKSKFTVTLSGSDWGTVKYGVVEFLRHHPRWRAATAILGVLWIVAYFASLAGFHPKLILFPTISAIFVTPTLLWLATVSGPDFKLTFPDPKQSLPSRSVENQATSPPPSTDPYDVGLSTRTEAYKNVESLARSSVRQSLLFVFLALLTWGSAAWLEVSRPNTVGFIRLALAPSIVFLIISALFFIRYLSSSRNSKRLFREVLSFQRIGLALKLASSLDTEAKKAAEENLVRELSSPITHEGRRLS